MTSRTITMTNFRPLRYKRQKTRKFVERAFGHPCLGGSLCPRAYQQQHAYSCVPVLPLVVNVGSSLLCLLLYMVLVFLESHPSPPWLECLRIDLLFLFFQPSETTCPYSCICSSQINIPGIALTMSVHRKRPFGCCCYGGPYLVPVVNRTKYC